MQKQRYLVSLAVLGFFFYTIAQLSLFNSLTFYLMHQLNLTQFEIGMLSSSYLYALAATLIPAGYFLDRFQTRICSLISFAFAIASIFILLLSDNLFYLILYRVISGIANGFAFLSALRVAKHWFSEHCALASGVMIAVGMSGGFFASNFFPFILEQHGFQALFVTNTAIGLFLIFIAFLFLKNHKEEKKTVSPKKSVLSHLAQIMTRMQNWGCGIYTGLLNLSVYVIAALWGNAYLIKRYSLPLDLASLVTSMVFIGIILGSPFWGWISDNLMKRKSAMFMGSVLSAFIVILIIATSKAIFSWLMLLFFLLGFTTGAQVISYAVLAEINNSAYVSTATSFSALLINTIGALAQPIFGWLLSDHIIIFNHTLKLSNDNAAMILLLFAFGLSILVALFIKDDISKPRSIHRETGSQSSP